MPGAVGVQHDAAERALARRRSTAAVETTYESAVAAVRDEALRALEHIVLAAPRQTRLRHVEVQAPYRAR
jgi:hypothetical protein